mmetsp:Transcript_33679/g.36281  ORF Transcript_33679/g.36281 Transcript_33679/m.36281 type:complete len:211 (+) Transcript_33679:156-788(+)
MCWRKIFGHRSAETQRTCFGSGIGNRIGKRQRGLETRNINDPAIVFCFHPRRHGPSQKEGCCQHYIETLLPVFGCQIFSLLTDIDAGIVQQNRRRGIVARKGLSLGNQMGMVVILENIGGQRKCPFGSDQIIDLLGTFDQRLRSTTNQYHFRTRFCHSLCQTSTNAGSTSRHNGNLSGQIKEFMYAGRSNRRRTDGISVAGFFQIVGSLR